MIKKLEYETDKSYKLRVDFITKNKNRKDVEMLSRLYVNVVLLGCVYSEDLMVVLGF